MDQDIIFTPLQFRNLRVENRIFRSSISGRFDNEDGSLTQTRINWECMFAKGGAGAIISSYVPVLMEGRIIAGYATVHRDEYIPYWQKLGEAVHSFDNCKFIMQLSHSGRQMDIPGVHNYARVNLSSTSRKESLHGFLCRAMSRAGDRPHDPRLRPRRLAGARSGPRRRRAARRQRLSVHPVPELGHQRPQGRVRRLADQPRALPPGRHPGDPRRGRQRLPSPGQAQRHRPQQRHSLGRQGQHARRQRAGRALVRGRGRGRAACLDRQPVSASAQSARAISRSRPSRPLTMR